MSQLVLSNVINISVSAAQQGIGAYNVNNLALFTSETPDPVFTDGYKIYKSASEVATDFGSESNTALLAISVFSQSPNILAGDGYLVVIPFVGVETLKDAIVRTQDLVQYFGIMTDEIQSDADYIEASTYVQTLNKMLFVGSRLADSVETNGLFGTIKGNEKTRGLLYIGSASADMDTQKFVAAYAGRALSTVFSGSNTTQTMHMKDMAGIVADAGMTQTILEKCKTVGADVYASFQGVAKTFCTGGNSFFDQVYNLCWLTASLEVAGFNALAQTSTKLPQTEQGVSVLKAAYRTVLEQAVANQYCAPGTWTSPDTFGNLADFQRNIQERGYYIYNSPVATQLKADREARKAPIIQIALKEAGAIHSSNVIVYVNA